MAWISRVRMTGGFLEGLDLELAPGLNVIVGPRGAGKTTFLELMRHALSLPGGPEAAVRQTFLRHALGSGEIILDIREGNTLNRLVVDGEGGGTRPDMTTDKALMLGQNELEEIADTPVRRLELIDMRAGIEVAQQTKVLQQLRTLTGSLHRLQERQEDLQELLRQKSSLLADRQRLRERESELVARNSGDLAPQRERLAQLERRLLEVQSHLRGASILSEGQAAVSQAAGPVSDVIKRLEATRVEASIRSEVTLLLAAMASSLRDISAAADRLNAVALSSTEGLTQEDLRLRTEAEPVRTSLDQTERGLGAVTAELRDLDAQLARLEDVEANLQDLQSQAREVAKERDTVQELLEDAAESLFDARDRAARKITEQLDHRVQISVRHLADTSTYRRTLAELLQGNGLKHNVLSETLAASTLPITLLRYVEQADVFSLSAAAGLPADRSARVLSALNDVDSLSQIAVSSLSDSVDFRLQDGSVLKSTAQLSTGQKCAVTMPIVLTDPDRLVILDQPEDHLDNQFLVDRIITSLVTRGAGGAQTIVATHNPNIPVLGSAVKVANLASDGQRGLIDAEGPYDSPAIVRIITTLMEGGREAFDKRAQFYASHPVS